MELPNKEHLWTWGMSLGLYSKPHRQAGGIHERKKGNSFIYVFNELSVTPPEEGMKVSFTVGEKKSQGRYLGEANSQYQFELEDDLVSPTCNDKSTHWCYFAAGLIIYWSRYRKGIASNGTCI